MRVKSSRSSASVRSERTRSPLGILSSGMVASGRGGRLVVALLQTSIAQRHDLSPWTDDGLRRQPRPLWLALVPTRQADMAAQLGLWEISYPTLTSSWRPVPPMAAFCSSSWVAS